jgi:hypothetical protein
MLREGLCVGVGIAIDLMVGGEDESVSKGNLTEGSVGGENRGSIIGT